MSADAPPRERAGWLFTLPALLWLAVFFALPAALLVAESLRPLVAEGPRQWSLGAWQAFFAQGAYVRALWNSIAMTAVVALCSVLLAYPFALAVLHVVPPRRQALALALAVLPFWTSYVVRSYAWLLALAPTGVISATLQATGLAEGPVTLAYAPGATAVGFVHFFIMLDALTIYAALRQIDPAYARAARDLGAGMLATFVRITLPLSLPGVAVGVFLTVILCLGDFVTPQVLGGMRELVLPQLMIMQIGRQLDLPMASVMSLLLTVVAGLAYAVLARPMRAVRV